MTRSFCSSGKESRYVRLRLSRESTGSHTEFVVESLERRRLLAGQVTIDVDDSGNVAIEGDARANQIELIGDDNSNTVTFRGMDDTRILRNGQITDELVITNSFGDVVGELAINMRGGDDVIVTRDLDFRDDVTISLGGGNDVLRFHLDSNGDATVNGSVRIDSGSGSDYIDGILELG